jgi:NAD-dependent DNA ligase/DNA polymerase/3'-5' exonuclease PolX
MDKKLKNPPLKKLLKEHLKMKKEEEKMKKEEEKQIKRENKLNKTLKKREKKVSNVIKNKTVKKKRVLIIEDSSSFSYTPLNIYNVTLKNVPQDVKGQPLPINQLKGNPPQEDCSISNVHLCKNELEKGLKDLQNTTIIDKNMNMNKIETTRLNDKFIDLMEQLSNIMLKQGEPFRARAYQKAQETIMSVNEDIINLDQLKGKPNIGPTIMEKLEEFIKTGTLKVIEREKNNPINILGEIYGVGPKKAKELVSAGVTNIEQLRANQDSLLNATQKTGLKYYEDILKRIPRSEIVQYDAIFKNAFNHVKTGLDCKYEIVGSYRRGAQTSGDIDVILTSSNPRIFVDFVDYLIKEGIILEVLSRGPSKCLVIAKIVDSDTARRVDFLYASPEEFPFSILYFTGSKIFNTVMRHQALNKNLTMNEHGLYSLVGKKKEDKVEHKFSNERDIFDYLGIEYKEPEERIDGRAVVLNNNNNNNTNLVIPSITNPIVNAPIVHTLKNKPVKEKKSSVKTRKIKEVEKVEKEEKEEELEKTLISQVNPIILDLINNFKVNGISVLEQATETQLANIIREANKLYYNSEPILSDNQYDIVKDFIQQKYPSNSISAEIGAPIERNKAALPFFMGSMDKIKPDTGALISWTTKYKGPYIISCKLDGVSGLYTTDGPVPKLYTRGNGTVGQDVSHFIPYLKLPKTKGIVIRGEFIVLKSIFDTKYKGDFANPRNMVAGIINHKTIDKRIQDVSFVAYEAIKPIMKPSDQMKFLGSLNVDCVLNLSVPTISNEYLSDLLVEWREKYQYEIDGIIVIDDKIYERKTGNPEHAFAFKMVLSDQIAEAKVVDVIWTPSKDGYLKPRVRIEPIQLGGVKIEYATGFNASFIQDNKIGIGSIIEIIRSGDVIPHIKKVTMAAEQPKMPSVPFKWNDTHVDIMLENIDSDETVREKNITGFFRGIGVEGLSSGNIARIINTGFDTVPKIIDMPIDEFLTVEGFKTKMATKLFEGIREKLQGASIITLMAASNIFGRGFSETKIELIMNDYPDILVSQESVLEKVNRVSKIKGMALKTADGFVSKIDEFVKFMYECGLEDKLVSTSTTKKINPLNPLFGKTIVMTGFRNKEIEEKMKDMGAKLGSSVSKNTFLVLVKNLDEDTGKAIEAKNLGIKLMTPEEFIGSYF